MWSRQLLVLMVLLFASGDASGTTFVGSLNVLPSALASVTGSCQVQPSSPQAVPVGSSGGPESVTAFCTGAINATSTISSWSFTSDTLSITWDVEASGPFPTGFASADANVRSVDIDVTNPIDEIVIASQVTGGSEGIFSTSWTIRDSLNQIVASGSGSETVSGLAIGSYVFGYGADLQCCTPSGGSSADRSGNFTVSLNSFPVPEPYKTLMLGAAVVSVLVTRRWIGS